MNFNHRNRRNTFPYSEGVVWPGEPVPLSVDHCYLILAGGNMLETGSVNDVAELLQTGHNVAFHIGAAAKSHPLRAEASRREAGYGGL